MNLTKEMKLEVLFKSKELSRATELMGNIQNMYDFISKALDTDIALKEVYGDVQELISLVDQLPEFVKSMNNAVAGSEVSDFKTFLFQMEAYILDLLEDE